MFSKNTFAYRIKLLRKEKDISQNELAKVLGVTKTAISDIERERRTTTIEKLFEIADYFDVSIDYLVGRTDNPDINK